MIMKLKNERPGPNGAVEPVKIEVRTYPTDTGLDGRDTMTLRNGL
jgi:hypothetical protein